MRQPSTLDLRLSARSSLPSSSSLSVRGPLHTLSRSPPAPTAPTSSTGTHHHLVRAIVLSLSFSLGQVRLSGPSHSPYSCLQPCPRCLSNLTPPTPSPPSTPPSPPPSCTVLLSPHSLSLFFFCVPTSTYHFYA